jgi:hypothetical protein
VLKCVVGTLVSLALAIDPIVAQTTSTDEKLIRALIVLIDSGKPIAHTEDSIFWNGALKRPVVGHEEAVSMPGAETRVGPAKFKTTVRRIDVSRSRDMAYDFSDAEVTVQEKGESGRVETRTFSSSSLRVWRKVKGQWRLAAYFGRPHEQWSVREIQSAQ